MYSPRKGTSMKCLYVVFFVIFLAPPLDAMNEGDPNSLFPYACDIENEQQDIPIWIDYVCNIELTNNQQETDPRTSQELNDWVNTILQKQVPLPTTTYNVPNNSNPSHSNMISDHHEPLGTHQLDTHAASAQTPAKKIKLIDYANYNLLCDEDCISDAADVNDITPVHNDAPLDINHNKHRTPKNRPNATKSLKIAKSQKRAPASFKSATIVSPSIVTNNNNNNNNNNASVNDHQPNVLPTTKVIRKQRATPASKAPRSASIAHPLFMCTNAPCSETYKALARAITHMFLKHPGNIPFACPSPQCPENGITSIVQGLMHAEEAHTHKKNCKWMIHNAHTLESKALGL